MYENNSIDARTLPQIWRECTPLEQDAIRTKIKSRLSCSAVTAWSYCNGKFSPRSPLVQKEIARIIKSTLGVNVSHTTLFPQKQ